MSKIKKFAKIQVKKIQGGKDPLRLLEEFIMRQGFDPEQCQQSRTPNTIRWLLPLAAEEELEVLIDGLQRHSESTIYLGLNVAVVPLRHAQRMLTAALEIADNLVGIKVSLVGHYLVLSASFGAPGIGIDDLEYNFRLIMEQKEWFREALRDEIGLEELPEA